MVAKYPALLTLSVESNLAPKLDLLLDEVGVPPETLIRAPQLLGYSLEGRILPRCAALLSARLLYGRGIAGILAPTDAVFEKRFGVIVEVDVDEAEEEDTDGGGDGHEDVTLKFLDPGISEFFEF